MNYAKEWIFDTHCKIAVIVSTSETDSDGSLNFKHSEEPNLTFDDELEISHKKLHLLNEEITKLNGGNPLRQPPKHECTPSTYILGDGVDLQTLPDYNGTFYIGLSGTGKGIERNKEKYKSVCGDGRNKTVEQVYEEYKKLSKLINN